MCVYTCVCVCVKNICSFRPFNAFIKAYLRKKKKKKYQTHIYLKTFFFLFLLELSSHFYPTMYSLFFNKNILSSVQTFKKFVSFFFHFNSSTPITRLFRFILIKCDFFYIKKKKNSTKSMFLEYTQDTLSLLRSIYASLSLSFP